LKANVTEVLEAQRMAKRYENWRTLADKEYNREKWKKLL
jgi:hypothetical protein